MNQHGQDFIKLLEHIKPSKHPHEVFNDWLIMCSASLYAPWKKDQAVENEYTQVAKQYTKEEFSKLTELLAIVVSALESKTQDFLGEVFMNIDLGNSRTGQFFTPYNVSEMMAKMMIGENGLKNNRICRINDPCCGAGGMLIASATVMIERKFNFQQDALFVGQDIDARCARMAYIQLSLLGAPAIISCENTLTMQVHWQRETIGYHMAGMDWRLKTEKMLSIVKHIEQGKQTKEQSIPELEHEKKPPVERKRFRGELVQGELF